MPDTSELPVVVAIDDDALQLRMLSSILGNRFTVLTASKAAHGIKLLETLKKSDELDDVHAIMVDIMMPHMNGLSILKLIRERFGNVPVVMCSGINRKDYVIKAIKLGANDYLLKPYRGTVLLERLSRVRRRSSGEEDTADPEEGETVDGPAPETESAPVT